MIHLLLTFDEALAVGERLHDRWLKMAGEVPFGRDDPAWGDIVQATLRFSREALEGREEKNDG